MDIKFPGANYKFGQLYHALALGQFEALSERKRLALRLHLESPCCKRLFELQGLMTQALKHAGP